MDSLFIMRTIRRNGATGGSRATRLWNGLLLGVFRCRCIRNRQVWMCGVCDSCWGGPEKL